jgi:hypothetical protein
MVNPPVSVAAKIEWICRWQNPFLPWMPAVSIFRPMLAVPAPHHLRNVGGGHIRDGLQVFALHPSCISFISAVSRLMYSSGIFVISKALVVLFWRDELNIVAGIADYVKAHQLYQRIFIDTLAQIFIRDRVF